MAHGGRDGPEAHVGGGSPDTEAVMEVGAMRRRRWFRTFRDGDGDMLVRTATCLAREIHGPGVPFELVIAFVAILVACVKVGGCIRILCPQG